MAQLSLSMNDILKDAQRIHEYRGDETYALTSFLREVDTIFSLIQQNAEAKEYIYQRVVLNKIQGEALHVLRTLGPNPSWDETKEALISNFGIHESYHQLYQHAFEAKNVCIINYYKQLREILCKLNEKYEYDKEKPVEFSPRSFNSNQYSRNYQRNGSNVHRSFGNVNNSSMPNVNSEMEVDHIQFSQNVNSNEEEQVNFLTTASKRHFQ